MIAAALLLLAQAPDVAASATEPTDDPVVAFLQQFTAAEIDHCENGDSGQPFVFCLYDQQSQRGLRELEALLPKVRAIMRAERQRIAEYKQEGGSPTLDGDPVTAFETSHRLWEQSYLADCLASSLNAATGNGPTSVRVQLACEADRILERVRYLRDAYGLGDE